MGLLKDKKRDDKEILKLFGIDEEEVKFLKDYLGLKKEDEKVLKEVKKILDKHADFIINSFYEHLLSFERTKAFFRDEKILGRVKEAQKKYFKRLTSGNYDLKYFSERIKIGISHDKIDLKPELYIGAYNKYLQTVLPLLYSKLGHGKENKTVRAILSLLKIVFLDMSLAMHAYITARERRIKEREEEYRRLLESAPDAIISATRDGRIASWNRAAEDIFGYEKEEIVGKPISMIIADSEREKHERGFQNFIKTGKIIKRRFESQGMRKNGEIFPVEVSLYAEASGPGYNCTAIIRDISEKKKIENELKERLSELEEFHRATVGRELKMIELEKEIEELKKKIEKLKEAKNER